MDSECPPHFKVNDHYHSGDTMTTFGLRIWPNLDSQHSRLNMSGRRRELRLTCKSIANTREIESPSESTTPNSSLEISKCSTRLSIRRPPVWPADWVWRSVLNRRIRIIRCWHFLVITSICSVHSVCFHIWALIFVQINWKIIICCWFM